MAHFREPIKAKHSHTTGAQPPTEHILECPPDEGSGPEKNRASTACDSTESQITTNKLETEILDQERQGSQDSVESTFLMDRTLRPVIPPETPPPTPKAQQQQNASTPQKLPPPRRKPSMLRQSLNSLGAPAPPDVQLEEQINKNYLERMGRQKNERRKKIERNNVRLDKDKKLWKRKLESKESRTTRLRRQASLDRDRNLSLDRRSRLKPVLRTDVDGDGEFGTTLYRSEAECRERCGVSSTTLTRLLDTGDLHEFKFRFKHEVASSDLSAKQPPPKSKIHTHR